MTKIDLSNIKQTKNKNGIYYQWNDSIGNVIPFVKDDIKGELVLLENTSNNECIQTVSYNGNIYHIPNDSKKNNKLSVIFGKNFKINWAYEVGDIIKDENKFGRVRNMTITAREHKKIRPSDTSNHKYYQYKCNICGYDCSIDNTWVEEVNIYRKKYGCPICASQKVIKGINDISTTNPEMLEYIIDKKFAETHTYKSHIKTKMHCPVCGFKKIIDPERLYTQGFACPKCSEYISYPEKFMMSVLDQNHIKYKYQLSKSIFSWCQSYKYDFYLYDYNCIIETHGKQHYEDTKGKWTGGKSQRKIDKTKKKLALNNNIDNYIEIDCSKSNQYYISKSITESELKNIIDLNNTDFELANKYAISSLIKEVCETYDNEYPNITSEILANRYHIERSTIINYLNQGVDAGYCKKYTPNRAEFINSQKQSKPLKVLHEDKIYCLYNRSLFKEWLIEHYNKSDHYYFLKQCLDNDKEYRGCKVYSITKEEYNNGFDNPNIICIGDKYLLDILPEYSNNIA